MSKHSPEPWIVSSNNPLEEKDECGVEKLDRIKSADGRNVAFIPDHEHPLDEENANAILMSAAPELLEALEACLPYADEQYRESKKRVFDDDEQESANSLKLLIDKANAAIAKARGEA